MIPYMLLLIIPILFSQVSCTKVNGKRTLMLGNSKRIRDKNLLLPIFFIFLLGMLVLRSETLGRDLHNYKYIFEENKNLSFLELNIFSPQGLFTLLNWLMIHIKDNFHLFLSVVAILTTIPLAYLYCKDRKYSYLKMILYLNLSNFIMLFSGIRQSLAISVGIIVYEMAIRKKLLWSIFFSFVALGIHHSGFVLFLIYPLCNIKIKKKHLFFILPMMLATFALNKQIFGILSSIISEENDKYDVVIGSTGAYGFLILSVIITIYCFVITNNNKNAINNYELIGLKNILLMIIFIQSFAPLHVLAMRLNYYFIVFLPIAMAKCIEYSSKKYKNVAIVGMAVICTFLTFNYVNTTYRSYVTGKSTLDTIPYRSIFDDYKLP